MLKLSYSTNGITNVDFFKAANEIIKAGYEGIEISFQKNQFHPYELNDAELLQIKNFFIKNKIVPVGISTGTAFFLSDDYPHEPSIISTDEEGRQQRLHLIKRGIDIAKKLNIDIVTFQTGHLRAEHLSDLNKTRTQLIEGIRELLNDIGNVTLVIEPEPGMFIESLEDGIELVSEISHPSFGLHLDIGHAFCTQENYVEDIANAIPYTKYMHLADIRDGYNLQFLYVSSLEDAFKADIDLSFAGFIFYINSISTYFFIDQENSIVFCKNQIDDKTKQELERLSSKINQKNSIKYIKEEDTNIAKVEQDIDLEIKAYIESVPKIPLDVLNQSISFLRFLRSKTNALNKQIIKHALCSTVRGKVHYHEVPGKGEIDFKAIFKALQDKNYQGYITVELYNHVDVWKDVLPGSFKYLKNCMEER